MNKLFRTVSINKGFAIAKAQSAIDSWTEVLNNPEAKEAHDLARRTIASNKRDIERIKKEPETMWN